MATVALRSRTSERPPGSWVVRVSSGPSRPAIAKQTVPTGFSGVPPSGPAMPVTPIP
jgi:hypothetical protein